LLKKPLWNQNAFGALNQDMFYGEHMVTDCANCPLRKLEAFERLKPGELSFMRKFKVGELVVEKGAPILMEGANSPQLYTVLRGMGLRYKLLPDGRRQVLNFVVPGDFLGLQAGVMGEMRHSVEATTRMVLCVFDRSELWTLFKTSPEQSYDLTWLASIQEHFLGEALASVGQMSAARRICWGLLRFHERCEVVGLSDGESCPLPFTQQDLADALGLSVVHTNKTLKRLRDGQVVSWRDGVLRFLDRKKAVETAMFEAESERVRPLL
jgi:CRP-like cAMP-binding protein